jgi:hypothetical protein
MTLRSPNAPTNMNRTLQLDPHYTPQGIAAIMVGAVAEFVPMVVADLMAGEGRLLMEAERHWPGARFVATDIDAAVIRQLSKARPRWTVGRCDILSDESRLACEALDELYGRCWLLLLNPPFSCRGATTVPVTIEGVALRTSVAMAHLLIAVQYLHADGHVVVVLPAGSLHSAKDAEAWRHLRKRYAVDVVHQCERSTFDHCAASATVVHLGGGRSTREIVSLPFTDGPRYTPIRASIVRGTCPIHRIPQGRAGVPLIHTTDIADNHVALRTRRARGSFRCIHGPAVLIPRVGRLTERKIGIFWGERRIMLSDCVIAITTTSKAKAHAVYGRLRSHFLDLRTQYVGTGAPFITLERLRAVLESLQIRIQ